MVKKILTGLLLLVGAVFLLNKILPRNESSKMMPKVILGNSSVVVEIADTSEKTTQGLSDRETLCSDCGMLFIFNQPSIYSFWMRRMHFDIDMIWIKDDQVVDISHEAKIPPVEELESPKTFYQSKTPCNMVLEVNSGWAEKNNVKIGTEFKLVSN